MNKHFSYLLEESDNEFFDKIAHVKNRDLACKTESVEEKRWEKTASIDKLATRLTSDLEIIKMAGDSGLSFGTIARGHDYIDSMVDRGLIFDNNAEEFFDKVASTTIEHDLAIIEEHLADLSGDAEWAKFAAADIGSDLIEAAMLEKEAFLRGGLGIRQALKSTKGLGLGARTKAVAGAPGRKFKGWRQERAVAKRDKAIGKLKKHQVKAKKIQTTALARQQMAKAIPDQRLRSQMVEQGNKQWARKSERLGRKQQKLQGKLDTRTQKAEGLAAPKAPKSTIPEIAGAPARSQKTLADKTQNIKAEGRSQRSKAVNEATLAANKGKSKVKTDKSGKPVVEDMTDAATHETGMMDSLKNLKNQGWSKLSPEEKNKVLQAGAGAYLAKETLIDQ